MIRIAYGFVGKRAALFGVIGVLSGFMIFAADLVMASALQRFFLAAGLISVAAGKEIVHYPHTPAVEAVFLISIGFLRAALMWANGFIHGMCHTTLETEKRKEIVIWALESGSEPVGKVNNLITDISVGNAAAVSGAFLIASRFIFAAGLLCAMLYYSFSLTLLVIACMAAIAPAHFLVDRSISRSATTIQKSLSGAVSEVSSAVKNALFIKLHFLQEAEIKAISRRISDYARASYTYYSLSSLRSAIPQTLGLIAVVLIVLGGSSQFGEASIMVAFLYLVLRLFQVLSDLASISANYRLNHPRVKVMFQWWFTTYQERSVSTRHQVTTSEPVGFTGEDLSYHWPDGTRTGIEKINFDIAPGSITLIHGPSGIGKTTLMHILLGLISPSFGRLTWYTNNVNPTVLSGRLPVPLAYVGPDPFIISGTIRDQLCMGQELPPSDDEMRSSLLAVGADFAQDLCYHVTEQGGRLSAGQKQRIALARAILRKPSLLLLDEATANLDPVSEQLVLKNLRDLNQGVTIILISHRPHPLLNPDFTIALENID